MLKIEANVEAEAVAAEYETSSMGNADSVDENMSTDGGDHDDDDSEDNNEGMRCAGGGMWKPSDGSAGPTPRHHLSSTHKSSDAEGYDVRRTKSPSASQSSTSTFGGWDKQKRRQRRCERSEGQNAETTPEAVDIYHIGTLNLNGDFRTEETVASPIPLQGYGALSHSLLPRDRK